MVTFNGYIYLINAFEKLYHANKNIQLVIIGDGKLKNKLQLYVNENNLQDVILFPGEIIDAKLLMPAFDVFVLSSLSEGFSLVVLEAMAAKIPIVATNVGIVPSIITAPDEIIPPENIEHLSRIMEKYYKMPDNKRALLGEELFQCLLDNFDIKLYRKKYLNLLQK